MIKSYSEFLLESVLVTSDSFKKVITKIQTDPVANTLLQLIDQDIDTPYNALDLGDQNDKIYFLGDNQFQSKLAKGENLDAILSGHMDTTSVNRVVNQILRRNGKNFTQAQIEAFGNKFKAAFTSIGTKSPIKIVSGEEIRKWYFERNYCMETLNGKGTLGNSCMRYARCQDYLDIYAENPNCCRLLILTTEENGEEVLRARALLWQTNRGLYIDRVYYTDGSEKPLLEDWITDNEGCKIFYSSNSDRLYVDLQTGSKQFDEYPYIDSIPYHDLSNGRLINWEPELKSGDTYLYCQNTTGGYDSYGGVYCEYLDSHHPEDDVEWSNYYNSYLPMHSVVYSRYLNDYIYEPESISIEIDGERQFIPEDHESIARDFIKNQYFLKKDMIQIGNYYYHKSNVLNCNAVDPSDYNKIKKILNLPKIKDDIYVDKVLADFFEIKTTEDTRVELLIDYYMKVYFYVLHDEYKDMIEKHKNASNQELKKSILEQLRLADNYLTKCEGFYYYNNIIHENGGLQKTVSKFIKLLNSDASSSISTRPEDHTFLQVSCTITHQLLYRSELPMQYSTKELSDFIIDLIKTNFIDLIRLNVTGDFRSSELTTNLESKLKSSKIYDDRKSIEGTVKYIITIITRAIYLIWNVMPQSKRSISESIKYVINNPNYLDYIEYKK